MGVEMRRLILVLALAVGLLFAGVTNVSASTYCSLDPTIGPLTFGAGLGSYGLNAHVALKL
jgi:hypothetical protein